MRRHTFLFAAVTTSIAGLAPAIAQPAQQPQARPCAAIRQVCVQAGFALNGARAGEGLVVDCIRPIMQGTPQPKRATKPLPAVDPALIEACRARNPNFGMPAAQGPRNRPPGQPNAPGAAPRAAPPGQPPGPDDEPQEPQEQAPAKR
jgi:hypothetical protein